MALADHFSSKRDEQRYRAGDKMERTMHEWKHGSLHSGSKKGPLVRNRKQAIAIAISQAKKAGQR